MASQPHPPVSRTQILRSHPEKLAYFVDWLSLQFALLGYTDAASRIIGNLNKYYKRHDYSYRTLRLHFLWKGLGEWPFGEKERVKDDIRRERERQRRYRNEGVNRGLGKGMASKAKEDKPEELPREEHIEELPDPVALVTEEDINQSIQGSAESFARYWNHRKPLAPEDVMAHGRHLTWLENGQRYDTYPGLPPDASREEKQKAIKDMLKMISNADKVQYEHYKALVSLLDLRLELESSGPVDSDVASAETILDLIAKMLMDEKYEVETLTESQRAWRILKDGALARAVGLDEKRTLAYIQEMESAIEERIRNGRLQRPEDQPMKEILEQLSHNTNTNSLSLEYFAELAFSTEYVAPGPLFQDPATSEQIRETEERLGIQLPSDYKEFATLSNGFKEAWQGIIAAPALHKLSEIRWLRDDEDYFTDLELEVPPGRTLTELLYRDKSTNKLEVEKIVNVGKAIEIGELAGDFFVWLIPPNKMDEIRERIKLVLESQDFEEDWKIKVRLEMESFAGSVEAYGGLGWTCMLWDCGGSSLRAWPSFKAYLQNVLEGSGDRVGYIPLHECFLGNVFRKREVGEEGDGGGE